MNELPWTVVVVVPARDEDEVIEACLLAILAAVVPPGVRRRVVVVADGCRDATAALARRVLGDTGSVVETDGGNVGRARRIGVRAALVELGDQPLDRIWIVTTDADSVVPAGWIQTHLALAEAGAEAVAGTVALAPDAAALPSHAASALAARYVVRADGSHPHVHGANLGIRADTYCTAGGWRPLPTGEDHDLWNRVRRAGAATVSTIESPVATSARTTGRAPGGFAALLAGLVAGVTT